MAIVDELITLLGFDLEPGSEGKARRLKASIDGIKETAKKTIAVISGLTAVVGAWTISVANATDQAGKLADSIDVSYESLQELEFAAQRAGGSAGELRGDLEKLTQFGPNVEATLLRLARQMDGLSDREAFAIGQQIGLSPGTIRLLQRGAKGIAELRAEGRRLGAILPEESITIAAKFADAMTNVKAAISGVTRGIAIETLPALTEAVQAFEKFFIANREIIRSGLKEFVDGVIRGFRNFAEMVGSVAGSIRRLLGPLGKFTNGLEISDFVAAAVTASLTAMAAVITFVVAKFALMGAAIGAVVLVFDDLMTFFRGGDSLIGRFFDAFESRFPGLFNFFREAVGWVGDKLPAAFNFLLDIMQPIFDTIEFAINGLVQGIGLIDKGLQKLGFKSDQEVEADRAQQIQTLRQRQARGREILARDDLSKEDRLQAGKILNSINRQLMELDPQGENARARARDMRAALTGGAAGGAAVSGGTAAPIAPSIIDQSRGGTRNEGDTNIFVNGAGSPNAVASEVVRQGGLRNVQQVTSPGIKTGVIQ